MLRVMKRKRRLAGSALMLNKRIKESELAANVFQECINAVVANYNVAQPIARGLLYKTTKVVARKSFVPIEASNERFNIVT